MNSLTPLKAVIWDVDGTMIDSEEMHRRAFNLAFAKHNLGWVWTENLYAPLLKITGGLERIRYYNRAMAEEGCAANPDDLIRTVYAGKKDFYSSFLVSDSIQLRPGVKRILGEIQAKDISLCIATATSSRNIDTLLKTQLAGLNINWAAIVAGNDVERKNRSRMCMKKSFLLPALLLNSALPWKIPKVALPQLWQPELQRLPCATAIQGAMTCPAQLLFSLAWKTRKIPARKQVARL